MSTFIILNFCPWSHIRKWLRSYPVWKRRIKLFLLLLFCNFLWVCFYLFLFYFLNFILFFNFTILYWVCHISKWICHRYTCVSHPEPSCLLPPRTIPLGCPSAPATGIKKNIFASVLMRWMKLEPIIQSEISQKEKKKKKTIQYTNAYIWNKAVFICWWHLCRIPNETYSNRITKTKN